MLILEFSHVKNPVVQRLYDQFSFNVIPRMGEAIANDAASYQYLVESIRRFPKQVCVHSSPPHYYSFTIGWLVGWFIFILVFTDRS